MFSEELKSRQQQSLFSDVLKKGNGTTEEETLYGNSQKNKPEFKSIDPGTVTSHQKNQNGYKKPSDVLQLQKDDTNGAQQGGAQQTTTNTNTKANASGPSEEKLKKMTVSKEPMTLSTMQHADGKDEYYKKNMPGIHFEVQFKSPLPEPVKTKLKLMAFYLINKTQSSMGTGDFYENSVTSFTMSGKLFDLTKLSQDEQKKYGGNTVFEFMRLEDFKDGDKKKACIQVRELGQEAVVTKDEATKKKEEEHFKKYFTLDASWTDAAEIEQLYGAVAKIPGSILGSIPATPFKREKVNIDGAGNQHPETLAQHVMNGLGEASITVFDSAFKGDSSMRYGDATTGFFGAFEQAIIHEIGHAFNGRKIKKALTEESARRDEWMKAYELKTACRAKREKGAKCRGLDKKMDDLEAKRPDLEAAKAAARTETGQGYDIAAPDLYVDKEPDAPFRKALEKDGGKAITKYGQKDIEENYAELFSLYFIDEARLKKMRPAVHEYFSTNYPK